MGPANPPLADPRPPPLVPTADAPHRHRPRDPYASQGYYGAQSAASPSPRTRARRPSSPATPLPARISSSTVPPRKPPAPAPAFPNDPYGGYDAVNYPSIPALIEHSQRGGFGGGGGRKRQPGDAPSGGDYGGSRATRPKEEPGAPR